MTPPDQELGGQANAFAGLASLYELASLADPRLSPEAEAKRVEGCALGVAPLLPPALRRLRMVEQALLQMIIALDNRQEFAAEAHAYAAKRARQAQDRSIESFKLRLPGLLSGAASWMQAPASSDGE